MLKSRLANLPVHALLILFAFTTIAPFYWMVTTSLKPESDVLKMPPDLFPLPVSLHAYIDVFTLIPIGSATWNSFQIAMLGTLGTLLFCTLAAYAFAKLDFPFKKMMFSILIATMMIPGYIALIPMYIVFAKAGWIDTFLPLIVPGVMINAYGVFMLKQFMGTIPDAYIEAAKIDGNSHLGIYVKIILPLCVPAIMTLGLFTFIGHWNNFLGPLIYLNSEEKFTLPLLINTFRDAYRVSWGQIMAGATVSILPIVILYLFTQKYFVEGITLSGIKG